MITAPELLRRAAVEFVGTFFLVFFVGLSNTAGVLGALVPGLTLMIIVFAGGHISLGSYNPAVSLALTLRPGLLSWKAFFVYVLAEMLGGLAGALMAWAFGGQTIPSDGSKASLVVIFFAEFLGSFALVTQVLNSGTR
jgi:aquaporin Z